MKTEKDWLIRDDNGDGDENDDQNENNFHNHLLSMKAKKSNCKIKNAQM